MDILVKVRGVILLDTEQANLDLTQSWNKAVKEFQEYQAVVKSPEVV